LYDCRFRLFDFFKLVSFFATAFKTFRAISSGEFTGVDRQMAVLTAQLVMPFMHEQEMVMLAGIHKYMLRPPIGMRRC
jgi:hypothetical protein